MEPFGVYVHWPFCESKCPYCDFNSHVRDTVDEDRWCDALLREIETAAESAPKRSVTSIFFGGGTPSLMPPETVAAVIARIEAVWGLAEMVEVTLEANPTSVEAGKFSALAQAGINRVSLGIQSLDDGVLRFLGRGHSAREAIAAIEVAAELFGRYSFDLIYARPEQRLRDWRRELECALALASSHISLYQLTIEQGTPFHGLLRRGRLAPLEDKPAAEMFLETRQRLHEAGMPAYETSNHASLGAECQHNLLYWRYQDYAGIGPGAHGRLYLDGAKHAVERRRNPERWLEAVERDGHGTRSVEKLNRAERLMELVIMGLRIGEGIPIERFHQVTGHDWTDCLDRDAVGVLIEQGLLEDDPSVIRATETGHLYLNTVLKKLLS